MDIPVHQANERSKDRASSALPCAFHWQHDNKYVGRCPDLFLGGVHGDDPLAVATELQQVIDEWDADHDALQEPLPPVRVRPMVEVGS